MTNLEGAKVVAIDPYYWTTLSGRKTFASLTWAKIHFLTPGGESLWFKLDFSGLSQTNRAAVYIAICEMFGIERDALGSPGDRLGDTPTAILLNRYVAVDRLTDLKCFTPDKPTYGTIHVDAPLSTQTVSMVDERDTRIADLEKQLATAMERLVKTERELASARAKEWLVLGPDDRWHIATFVLDMLADGIYEPAWVDRNGSILFRHDICKNVERLPK